VKRILLLTSLLLVACSGSSGSVSCSQDYWDGTFGTCLPQDWIVVDRETLRQRGVPEETIVAFQSETAVSGQFPTIVLTSEPLGDPVSPEQYSEASIRSVTVLPSYELIDTRDVNVDNESVKVHIFKAQPVEEEPIRRFYQLSTVAGDEGFTLTATTPISIGETLEQQITLIFRESTFQEPTDE
jgi:hypothetical protein